jgi:ribosomal protein S18 acetylase RimI-like enzyme
VDFNASIARRIIRNSDLRIAQGPTAVYDLRGARAVTFDAPIAGLNCLFGFRTQQEQVDALLDAGFALLRAFDRDPAVEVTPLDRPKSLAKRLKRRGLAVTEGRAWMAFDGDATSFEANPSVEVRLADADDARDFALIHAGGASWVRKLSYPSIVEGLHDRRNAYYLGCIDGIPVATLHMLTDGKTAGIYAVATLRAHRGNGVSSTLLRRAILDAQARRCDVICLSTAAGGKAQSLYERLGFTTMFESQMWTATSR